MVVVEFRFLLPPNRLVEECSMSNLREMFGYRRWDMVRLVLLLRQTIRVYSSSSSMVRNRLRQETGSIMPTRRPFWTVHLGMYFSHSLTKHGRCGWPSVRDVGRKAVYPCEPFWPKGSYHKLKHVHSTLSLSLFLNSFLASTTCSSYISMWNCILPA